MLLRTQGELPYEVRAYRGSYLELLLALEPLESGTERTALVIHLPGFNEDSVRSTPLLELYSAGVRYRKALETLITEAAAGRVRPEQVAAFREQGGASLEAADAWLAAMLESRSGGVTASLRAMSLPALVDDLFAAGAVADQLDTPQSQAELWEHFQVATGMPATWRDNFVTAAGPKAEDALFSAGSWALCVEYVQDLKRPPVDARLNVALDLQWRLVDVCRRLADHLRARYPKFYENIAEETQAWLAEELDAARAEDLGRTDTFRFEEDIVLAAALDALGDSRWRMALDWAEARAGGEAFWLRSNPARLSAWQLIESAARLGLAIERAGANLGASDSLEQAIDRYREAGFAVDQAHRHLEQRRMALLYPQLPEIAMLRDELDRIRGLWRAWADAWAADFNGLCRSRGFLPAPELQQRNLFEDVVRPLIRQPGATALFLVDALRFEMGEELFRLLAETPATTSNFDARLAELPTVTEVGMNLLPPVTERGRLHPMLAGERIRGFSVGEFTVTDSDSRKRAIHARVGGATCPWMSLEEVVSRDATRLKQAVARARLVVVHSLEIDNAGEKGVGPAFFDHAIQRLRAAWRLLRDAGVRRFVITSDHGFLLLGGAADTVQSHGRKIDPKRRHVFSTVAADHRGEVRVSLADLGYEGVDGHLMFPETTALFDTGQRIGGFAHGGNSLQERVIPVLTLLHRAAAGADTLSYVVTAKPLDGVAGMHCIRAEVDSLAQGALDFGGKREVELALRVPDESDVQAELCQTRGGARLAGSSIFATVGQGFELFFRLSGSEENRVLVELIHPTAESNVVPCVVQGRFAVTPARTSSKATASTAVIDDEGLRWLALLPSEEVRSLFRHLTIHGAVTESEAAAMLGGQRALRRFALRVEEYARQAPFGVRIDVVTGVKRYVREGSGS